jgi:pimeloyl-ACP methyl ester carboxylesterase
MSAIEGLDAIALDLPGFGASPPPPDAWGAAAYADAIEPIMREEFAEPAVVLGHSFGGRVAVCLAATHPEHVRAIVLAGVPLLRRRAVRRPPAAYRMLRALHRARMVSDGRMEWARLRYGSRDYRAATGVMRGVLVRAVNESYENELRSIRCPVELVWGGADIEVPVEVAERAAELLSNARLTVIHDADHFTPLRSNELREAIETHVP